MADLTFLMIGLTSSSPKIADIVKCARSVTADIAPSFAPSVMKPRSPVFNGSSESIMNAAIIVNPVTDKIL